MQQDKPSTAISTASKGIPLVISSCKKRKSQCCQCCMASTTATSLLLQRSQRSQRSQRCYHLVQTNWPHRLPTFPSTIWHNPFIKKFCKALPTVTASYKPTQVPPPQEAFAPHLLPSANFSHVVHQEKDSQGLPSQSKGCKSYFCCLPQKASAG